MYGNYLNYNIHFNPIAFLKWTEHNIFCTTTESAANRGVMMSLLLKIRHELKQNSDSHTIATGQNFFKEKVKIYGVKTAIVTKIGKQYARDILAMPKKDVFALCETLWQSGYMEESFIACHFSYLIRKDLETEDFKILEKWVGSYVSNWASCDTLCNHTVAAFVEMNPEYLEDLKKWAKSKNRWVRRAAAVTMIIPARNGKFLNDIFEIADRLLEDDDDLVQKGYGWMLKAASEAHQKQVFEYVMKNKAIMPRTALRYAIEKMPKDLKAKAMEKQEGENE
jgi:3-methyladenine DNA glycosylase AlkD